MMRFHQRLVIAVFLAAAATAGAQSYHVAEHWKIGGQGSWDYLLSDDAAHRLYIAHNARVEVVDSSTGELIGAVTGLKSTHGIALDPAMRLLSSAVKISPFWLQCPQERILMASPSSRAARRCGPSMAEVKAFQCWIRPAGR